MSLKQIDCFEINMKFWKFLAMWPGENSSDYYKYYRAPFIIFVFFTFDVLSTINLYFLPKQLDLFIEEMLFYFTEMAVLAKALTFLFMFDKIKDIFGTLECDIFQPKNDYGLKIVDDTKKLIKTLYKITAVVSYTSNITHVLSPLIAHIIFPIGLELPICSYLFIPKDIKSIIVYPLYFYQSIVMHCNMLVNVNTDTFLWGIMTLTIAQLEVLDYNLRHITEYVDDESVENGLEKEEVLKLSLHRCILHFAEINRFCSLIEKSFSVCLFVQFSASSCIICVSLFRFTLPAPTSYYIFLTTYMTAMVIQILMPCWFGTRIMETSSSLSVAIYNCDWIQRSRHFKITMILFVERMKRPLSITSLKMFPLLLTTFTKIMNTAYSFYTLLRNMQTRE